MRKIYTRLFFTAVMLMVCTVASAYDFKVGGIYYNKLSDNTCAVTYKDDDYNAYSGSVIIPANTEFANVKYYVTSIGEHAFCDCTSLTSVTIPSYVTIDEYAFSNCSGLTSITIPNYVFSIGDGAFYNCTNITSITIQSGVTSIGIGAFQGCSGLTSVTIPSSVTSIEGSVFSGCSELNSLKVEEGNTVYDSRDNCNAIIETASNKLIQGCNNTVIPSSVTSIGDYAFDGCSGLTSITIPSSVTSIGECAFFGCTGLTSVTIPSSVTSIGNRPFSRCSELNSLKVEEGNAVYDSRDNCNAVIETASNSLVQGCCNTVIPSSVTSIGESAFGGCSGLTSITIPSSVTSIGKGAFSGCSGLTSITIPSSVTSIGNNAFFECSDLTSITIASSVTSIGDWAFSSCKGLTSITIPSSVTSIGDWAFSSCKGLTSITIPSSVTSIGAFAFMGCSGLTSVTIPSSVTSIGYYAFDNCSGLTSVTNLATTPQSLDTNVFSGIASDATLHVLPGCKAAYEAADQWKDFTTVIDDVDQVATPTISYVNGKVHFSCETEGVTYHYGYSMKSPDDSTTNDSEITLAKECTVSVYATKDGYVPSATATKTIKIDGSTETGVDGDINGDGKVTVADVSKLVEKVLSK